MTLDNCAGFVGLFNYTIGLTDTVHDIIILNCTDRKVTGPFILEDFPNMQRYFYSFSFRVDPSIVPPDVKMVRKNFN